MGSRFWPSEGIHKTRGHSNVPKEGTTPDGYRLGNWINAIRRDRYRLLPERKAQLESLPGWVWDAITEQWDEGFRHLTEFAGRESHCKVPATFNAADGYPLGRWVVRQRGQGNSMTPERKARLESMPGWVWNARAVQWEEGFRYLVEFAGRTGHGRVPFDFKESDGYRLGQWVSVQRLAINKLSPERKLRLEQIAGWAWSMKSSKNSDAQLPRQ
ncbi:MAG: helicase associated domain-containing protein [Sulfuritalea sp.]|nr:helicase associated domain-containing protein [Sulfuritalea sp.]